MEGVLSYSEASSLTEEELTEVKIALDIHIDNINKASKGGAE